MKKKILYIHHGKGIGGAPLSLLYLIQALDKNKYDPIVLFLHDSDAKKLFEENNIKTFGPVNRYDFPHTRIWWLRWYHASFFLTVLRDTVVTLYSRAHYWITLIKPDIVHLNTSSLIAWGIVAKKYKIPVVWHIRELLANGYSGLRKKIITTIIRTKASAIIPICKHDAQPWAHNKKTTIIYNAVQRTRFDYTIKPDNFITQHKLETQAPKILFLGGLSEEKGTELILTIFEQLLKKVPNAQLLIAGYFTHRSAHPKHNAAHPEPVEGFTNPIKKYFPAYRFKRRVEALYQKLAPSITLLGPITNVQEALAASDVLVFPATIGHFARPVIEAGFMKKPVVATQSAPLSELVIDKQTGFLVDQHDIKLWVERLELLLTNKDVRTLMGEQAYEFCLQHFSIEQQIKKIEHVYQDLLNKQRIG